VERHPNGKLKSGVLAITVEPQAVQGRELKASNKVFFSPDGRLEAVEIAADQEILGHWWKGGTRVEFHLSDGSVSKGVLAKDQEVQWIEWKGGTALEFYPDSHGNVFRGTLAKDQEMLASGVKLQGVDGIKFKGGQPLELHLNRSVQYGYLAGRQHIQGIEWQGDESMIFHPNGTVSEGTLARDQEIPVLGEKIRWRAATIMALHSNGGVHRGTLAFDQKIQGINFAAPTKCVNPPGTPFNACDEGEIELHRVILNPHGSLVSGTMRNGSGRLVSYFIPGPTPERH
jgi:hypothetical protein